MPVGAQQESSKCERPCNPAQHHWVMYFGKVASPRKRNYRAAQDHATGSCSSSAQRLGAPTELRHEDACMSKTPFVEASVTRCAAAGAGSAGPVLRHSTLVALSDHLNSQRALAARKRQLAIADVSDGHANSIISRGKARVEFSTKRESPLRGLVLSADLESERSRARLVVEMQHFGRNCLAHGGQQPATVSPWLRRVA